MVVTILGMLISYVCHLRGGRGRAGAGRRGKTMSNVVHICLQLIGGRGRAGAGRWKKTGVMGITFIHYMNMYAYFLCYINESLLHS